MSPRLEEAQLTALDRVRLPSVSDVSRSGTPLSIPPGPHPAFVSKQQLFAMTARDATQQCAHPSGTGIEALTPFELPAIPLPPPVLHDKPPSVPSDMHGKLTEAQRLAGYSSASFSIPRRASIDSAASVGSDTFRARAGRHPSNVSEIADSFVLTYLKDVNCSANEVQRLFQSAPSASRSETLFATVGELLIAKGEPLMACDILHSGIQTFDSMALNQLYATALLQVCAWGCLRDLCFTPGFSPCAAPAGHGHREAPL